MSYLGLDLGTSGLRALLVSEAGETIGAAERGYVSTHSHPGWSEQDPGLWIQALEQCVGELRAKFPEFARLQGIAVAGHMHGATLLDADARVIRPCMLWNDSRAHLQASALDALPRAREITGNIVFPGFTAPKVLWVRDREPENFRRIAKVLLPAAYLNHYLTGDFVADMSDSAGTSWLDVSSRSWSREMLDACDLSEEHMPRLVEGCETAGRIKPTLARDWGVSESVIVAGGAGDNAAAACGIGALQDGDGFLSIGTSGVLLAARDGYYPSPSSALHTFCHAVPRRWYQMGVILSATDSLNWLAQVTGASPTELTSGLGDKLHPPGRVKFFPYLSGERTPHNDASVRGGFVGLGKDTTRDVMTLAVLEGVAFGLRDSLEALTSVGTSFERLFAIGGGTRSRYWLQVISSVFNCPLELPIAGEFGAALGSARLARLACTGEEVEDVLIAPEIGERVMPNAALVADFDAAYQEFRDSFGTFRGLSFNDGA